MTDMKYLSIVVLAVIALLMPSGCGMKRPEVPDKGDIIYGLSVVVEPEDIEFYESYLPKGLTMSEKPLVGFFIMYVTLPPSRFIESGILLACEKDGKLGWAEVGIFVDDPSIYVGGSAMGGRKLMSEQVELKPDGKGWRTDIRRFGKEAWGLDFTPMPLSAMGDMPEWQAKSMAMEKYVPMLTEPRYGVSKMFRQVSVLDLGPIVPDDAEVTTGMMTISLDSTAPWGGLVKSGTEAPGVFIKFEPNWEAYGTGE